LSSFFDSSLTSSLISFSGFSAGASDDKLISSNLLLRSSSVSLSSFSAFSFPLTSSLVSSGSSVF